MESRHGPAGMSHWPVLNHYATGADDVTGITDLNLLSREIATDFQGITS